MKSLRFAVLLAGMAVVSAPAFATSITFTGHGSFSTTGFTTSTTGSANQQNGTVSAGYGTGSTVHYTLPPLTVGSQQDAIHFTTGTNVPTVGSPIEIMTYTSGGEVIDLYFTHVATSPAPVGETASGAFASFTATGYFTVNGGAPIATTVVLTATSKAATGLLPFNAVATFTGSLAQTPEPSSLMLMGTGLLALGGVARRKLFVQS